MKKLLSLVLALMLLAALPALAESDRYVVDRYEHWNVDENGEKINAAAHELDYGYCTVCNASIYEDEYGLWLYLYDEDGNELQNMEYDADGNLLHDVTVETMCDENGNRLCTKEYDFGVLVQEIIFETFEDEYGAFTYGKQYISYQADGSRLVETCDENGWAIAEALYNADGSVAYDYTIENEFNELDLIARIAKSENGVVIEETLYEYDEFGNTLSERVYANGALALEQLYTSISDGDSTYSYLSKEIVYEEDGSQTVTEYDEYGEIIE